MALINNLRVTVVSEKFSEPVESTSHPVETGISLTDTVKRSPITLSISGFIVDVGATKANTIFTKLRTLKNSGSLITYSGRTNLKNMQIQSFDASYSNAVWGGMEFNMELKEVRIAKSSYKAPAAKKKASNKSTAVSAAIKVGSKVVFKGGNVYVSSDAKKAAAKRGRSTCKVTQINTKSWAKHQYHLISSDGGKVYGWVDKANIESAASTSTKAKSNAGTQQTTKGTKKPVYHTVKKGETVYNLVNKNYKSLGKSVSWVINNNPKAFSKKGDARTLKIGAKLLMGYKG